MRTIRLGGATRDPCHSERARVQTTRWALHQTWCRVLEPVPALVLVLVLEPELALVLVLVLVLPRAQALSVSLPVRRRKLRLNCVRPPRQDLQ